MIRSAIWGAVRLSGAQSINARKSKLRDVTLGHYGVNSSKTKVGTGKAGGINDQE